MTDPGTLVYLAGSSWDGVVGTDRQLVTALGRSTPVLWVDPPLSQVTVARERAAGGSGPIGVSEVAAGVRRLRVLGPPGITRPGLRSLAVAEVDRRLHAHRKSGSAVVVATPEGRFPHLPGRRVYYVTDDWPAGAAMMGMSRQRIERLQLRNARRADVVAAVSPLLVEQVAVLARPGARQLLLPNGCDPAVAIGESSGSPRSSELAGMPAPFAIIVGQINERIDLQMLHAVVDRGVPLVMVGPRTDREPEATRQLDALVARAGVRWLGRRAADEVPAFLAAAAVGLTPYVDNAFNRASFPLKTLEYLAAGLPVVATDLPAVRWLDTPLVDVVGSPGNFADAVQRYVADPAARDSAQRQAFAREHSWSARAEQLLAAL